MPWKIYGKDVSAMENENYRFVRKNSGIPSLGCLNAPSIRQISGREMERILSNLRTAVLVPYRGELLWEDGEMKVYKKACRPVFVDNSQSKPEEQ